MAKGKRRRRVAWRVVNDLAHAFVQGSSLSVCGAFTLTESGRRDKEVACRACEVGLDQLW